MLSELVIYVAASAMLFGLGVYGVLISTHALRKLLAVNVMGTSVFLLLVTIGRRDGGIDPVLQAMVLTGIVIAVSATALAVSLLVALYRRSGRVDLEDADEPEHDV